ncbi:MAG: DNA mismatch repair protein MutL, partial [Flavobacteriaceae bacterium]|nr:DNA mismatch repair protein MutL [Flavobacteriaceae bacterium]
SKTYQVHKKYIVSSIKSGIVYINQHLAHQRILYEEFLENITIKDAMNQQLLFPLELSFNKADIASIKEIKADLESIGFLFGEISNDTIVVMGMPVNIVESQIVPLIEHLLEDIKNDIPDTSFSHVDMMAKSLSKSLAIKTGTKLDLKEQEDIVNKLFLCKQPDSSPFGKRTFVTVNIDEIDKKFNN